MDMKSASAPDWLNSAESEGGLRCMTRAVTVNVSLPVE